MELFCIDHLVMVTVEANDEFLYLDLAFPTTKLHARGMGEDGGDDMIGGLNGMEAAFQAGGVCFCWGDFLNPPLGVLGRARGTERGERRIGSGTWRRGK